MRWTSGGPAGEGNQGWMLAGGLTSANVAEAVSLCHPDVVDVSSGATAPPPHPFAMLAD